ncbi:MAG: hypothetical protein LUQ50_02035 [Methanospirillum sp.]|uniref:hypothetical protein n=1 Tax=Methanospirillum sp. TaxID=45200 RepID=UPI00236D56B7|nr:hypothetical protein [Methanospirillum sp.]MDD1727832.1 hypothetical protein [Methanospirillum sp.]
MQIVRLIDPEYRPDHNAGHVLPIISQEDRITGEFTNPFLHHDPSIDGEMERGIAHDTLIDSGYGMVQIIIDLNSPASTKPDIPSREWTTEEE